MLVSFRARRTAPRYLLPRAANPGIPVRFSHWGEGNRTAPAWDSAAAALSRMAAPPTEEELPRSTATIDSVPVEILTEILLRVSTPAALVHAAAASRSWRRAIANPEFLASYRKRHKSSPFLGLYVPCQLAGPPSFHMPVSIRCAGDDTGSHHLKDAALRAFDFGEIRRYQDHRLQDAAVDDVAFILGRLRVHPDCRLLDCNNSRLLLTRGDEALEVHSPLARESILLPFPPDADPDDLEASLLQGHDEAAASFRVVYLQHRREGCKRQVRAVEYDSTMKSWQHYSWQTIKRRIEGSPEEVMHAGHRMFCRYKGPSQAALMLDTRKMEFSVLPLPTSVNFAIGEIEDNVCCLVESIGTSWFKVWKLEEEKLEWKPEKDISLDPVSAKHPEFKVGYYRPRAISNGIALVCSTTLNHHHHFVLDLKTCSLMEKFEFQGRFAYIMQMPWPPAFSHPTAAGEFDRDGEPAFVGDSSTVPGELDEIEGLLGGAPALAEEPMHMDTCQTRPEPSPSPSHGFCFSTDPLPLLSLEQVLSTGEVPAEFAVPKPDANMAEASEGAERMHKDGLKQESEVDGQKQDKESPPTRRVTDAKERKRERGRARWHTMSQEERERARERDRARRQAMSEEQLERKRERDRARWHAMSPEKRERKRERDRARWHAMSPEKRERKRESGRARLRKSPTRRAMNPGSSEEHKHELRDVAVALNYFLSNEPEDLDIEDPTATATARTAPPAAPAVEPEEPLLRVWIRTRSLNDDLMLQPLTLASCTQQGGKLDGSRGGKGSHEATTTGQRRRQKMLNPKYLGAEWLIDDDWCEQ